MTTEVDKMIADMYLSGISNDDGSVSDLTITELSEEFMVPVERVRKIIFGEDESGRDADSPYRKKLLLGGRINVKSYVRYKDKIFLKSQATAISVLQKGLNKYLNSDVSTLNIPDLKDLSIIAGNLDKMYRLESGMPTDIVKNVNMSPQKIINIIESDPMYGGNKHESRILPGDSEGKGSEDKESGGGKLQEVPREESC